MTVCQMGAAFFSKLVERYGEFLRRSLLRPDTFGRMASPIHRIAVSGTGASVPTQSRTINEVDFCSQFVVEVDGLAPKSQPLPVS
jgi:hypothetical protein